MGFIHELSGCGRYRDGKLLLPSPMFLFGQEITKEISSIIDQFNTENEC